VIINLYKHRGYIWRTALAEVRHRYAGAGLGVVWNILQPLAMIVIFTVIFTQLLDRQATSGTAYPIFLCAALLPWSAFSDCVNRGTFAFVSHAIYLRKLPIPEQVFVAQTALATAINLAISFSVLVVFALILRHPPTWHWLLVPIPLALLLALGFGLGMALGTVNAFIRDVGQAVPILLQIGFWLVPVVYPEEVLPESIRPLLRLNPVYPYLTAVRDLFVYARMPELWIWPAMVAWAVGACSFGYLVLRRLRPELRDVI
jgi:lipopolysaccharide transport system permease protein